ncbi:hypothetical protein Zmor_000163 [Zophobas morio]|uniref:Uncharacterized protein n=1 Tax=Zophobas morio TaxID=2755281 RepID=A0AA38J0X0_9CUCU|nr:hypothetical protein Zmor_000163 [Zophobas morio]
MAVEADVAVLNTLFTACARPALYKIRIHNLIFFATNTVKYFSSGVRIAGGGYAFRVQVNPEKLRSLSQEVCDVRQAPVAGTGNGRVSPGVPVWTSDGLSRRLPRTASRNIPSACL